MVETRSMLGPLQLVGFAQRPDQFVDAQWFAHVIVHSGFQAKLTIAFHCVRGRRDDAWLALACDLFFGCAEWHPSHLIPGICISIKITS